VRIVLHRRSRFITANAGKARQPWRLRKRSEFSSYLLQQPVAFPAAPQQVELSLALTDRHVPPQDSAHVQASQVQGPSLQQLQPASHVPQGQPAAALSLQPQLHEQSAHVHVSSWQQVQPASHDPQGQPCSTLALAWTERFMLLTKKVASSKPTTLNRAMYLVILFSFY
jgi:hypothetical protein